MIVSITGHRPEDLPNQEWVEESLKNVLDNMRPEKLIQGMAAGVDLLSAKLCIDLNIPFVCAKPWAGHTPRKDNQSLYSLVEAKSQEIVNVNPSRSYPGAYVYHNRNHYMVDHADLVIAVWTGKKTGGTAECVKYAKKVNKRIIQINPEAKTVTELTDETLF